MGAAHVALYLMFAIGLSALSLQLAVQGLRGFMNQRPSSVQVQP